MQAYGTGPMADISSTRIPDNGPAGDVPSCRHVNCAQISRPRQADRAVDRVMAMKRSIDDVVAHQVEYYQNYRIEQYKSSQRPFEPEP